MPRTTITPATLAGGSTSQPAFKQFSFTAGDAANGNQFAGTGKEIPLFYNANASSPTVSRKVTLQHPKGGQIEKTMAAGEYWTPGQLPTAWRQNDNYIYFDPEHADVKCAVLVLP